MSVLAQQSPDNDPQLCPCRFVHSSVDGGIFPYRLNQLFGYLLQDLIAQHLNHAVNDKVQSDFLE
jgi:hypothetical protein